MSSQEELESALKKAIKSLEGEKRAMIKKAKGTKGKKAKEAVAKVEEEFEAKVKQLESEFREKLQGLGEGTSNAVESEKTEVVKNDDATEEDMNNLSAKERKLEKARRKKERQKEKERKKQEELEAEEANAGPSLRQVELEQIQAILTPLNLKVSEVDADGNCLYRAVGAQTNQNYTAIRNLCADILLENRDEFAPFCEYTDEITSFDEYVNRVRDSAEWGGHIELRALGMGLKRPIQVYSVQSGTKPLLVHDPSECNEKPIRLSYHLHYYALGEHYNEVTEN